MQGRIDLADLTRNNIGQLRKLNSALFPVRFSERWYKDVLEEDVKQVCKYGGCYIPNFGLGQQGQKRLNEANCPCSSPLWQHCSTTFLSPTSVVASNALEAKKSGCTS